MSRFTVPAAYQRGLQVLRDLTPGQRQALAEALEAAADFRSVRVLSQVVSTHLPSEKRDEADRILDALLTLRGQIKSGVMHAGELATRVASSERLEIDPDHQQAYARLLERLISADAIATTSDAADLLVQHEHPYRGSRIISEIRPVFSEDPAKPPRGAVLLHTLQMGYWNPDGSPSALDIAMDLHELRELHEVVERALTKAETLRGLLESSGVQSFDLGDGE